ncbi:unnamed protein product, partial [Polarella glacialis]
WTFAAALVVLGCPEALEAFEGDDGSSCSPGRADTDCHARAGSAYFWPMQKGNAARTGLSPYAMPSISQGPSWHWQDDHNDVIRSTPLIDGELNVYLTTVAGRIYKFSPEGKILWTYDSGDRGSIPGVPALLDGVLFALTTSGFVLALDMDSGSERWAVQVAPRSGFDTPCMFAANNTLVFAVVDPVPALFQVGAQSEREIKSNKVVALSAADGSLRWRFTPDTFLFNFQAASPGDGTLVFQDQAGGLYRLAVDDGRKIWRAGRLERAEFSTGASVVHDGMVFAVSNVADTGLLHAYDLETGELLWQQTLGHPANQAVAVGHLAGSPEGEASVVLGIGDNPGLPIIARLYQQMHWLPGFVAYPLHLMSLAFPKLFSKKQPRAIVAFSARTGALRWWYELEAFHYPAAAGESERLLDRLAAMGNGTNPKNDPLCLPDSCAQPVLDSAGTVFVPFQDGKIYAIRDDDADGIINPATEVSTFDVGDGFQASLALAPGLLAAAPCGGGLHVFRS